ncbi:MAG: hypothetical protein MHPSP_000345, partial [Paramarteilia canceri]
SRPPIKFPKISCDWSQIVDPNSKQIYYLNNKTNEKSIEKPLEYKIFLSQIEVTEKLQKRNKKAPSTSSVNITFKEKQADALCDTKDFTSLDISSKNNNHSKDSKKVQLLGLGYEDSDNEEIQDKYSEQAPIVQEIEEFRKELLKCEECVINEPSDFDQPESDEDCEPSNSAIKKLAAIVMDKLEKKATKSSAYFSTLVRFKTRYVDWRRGVLDKNDDFVCIKLAKKFKLMENRSAPPICLRFMHEYE